MNLSDQTQRERFFTELEQNFSVIAPAGVGKTSAIVQRILQMAQSDLHKGTSYLKTLVVVTYGQKAAEEMAERTRNALSEEFSQHIFPHFPNFGTIHSLCLQLLQSYGPGIGLPSSLKLLEDDTDLWDEFLITAPIFSQEDFLEQWQMLKHYIPLSLLLKGARQWPIAAINKKSAFFVKNQKIPVPELSSLLNFQANNRNEKEIEKAKHLLELWQRNQGKYNPIPYCEKGGKDFQLLWQKTFFPTQAAIEEQSLPLIQMLAQAYQDFRLEQSYVTYDDMIALANQLLTTSVARTINVPSYRILLDEAQDTDPLQFELLLRLAQKQISEQKDLVDLVHQIPLGNFCMVGDPQQSIFGSRADLKTYINIHNAMKTLNPRSELRFEVTLRCDQAIADEVNLNFYEKFPQVFFPLKAQPGATPGKIEEWAIDLPAHELANASQRAEYEANQFALKLAQVASELENDLSHIAILAPRNQWLESIKKALDAHQIPCQLHSSQQIQSTKIPYAWFSALIHLLCYPEDSFELAGVLREIYGIEDQALLLFREQSKLLKLQEFPSASSPIEVIINELYHLQQKCLLLPLRSAVEMLVASTHLEKRLEAIQYPNIEKELFYWKSLSNHYEDLYAFESFLRQQRLKPADTDNKLSNHIQLYSCHKSKGLEWPTVILPFFYRKIEFRHENYPYLQKTTQGTPRVLLNKASERTFSSDERNSELQRLTYVAFTRARHRLILIDDRQLWKDAKGSFADLINFDSAKRTSDRKTYSFPSIRANPPESPQKTAINSSPSFQEVIPEASKASLIARQIPYKINPSSWQDPSEAFPTSNIPPLSESPLNDTHHGSKSLHNRSFFQKTRKMRTSTGTHINICEDAASAAARHMLAFDSVNLGKDTLCGNLGLAYGIWWHETLAKAPWKEKEQPKFFKFFRDQISSCPATSTGEKEIQRLLKDPFFNAFLTESWKIATEVALFLPLKKHIIEGNCDWIAQNSDSLCLIDWKTERVHDLDSLVKKHQQQVSFYTQGLRKIFPELQIQTYLYFTEKNHWIQIR